MERKEKNTEALLKERRFLVALPIIVVPFLAMAFWALGGGGDRVATVSTATSALNTGLPTAANPDDATLDKMTMYSLATKDSLARIRALKSDPYYRGADEHDSVKRHPTLYANISGSSRYNDGNYNDAREAKVYERLEELNRTLAETETKPPLRKGYSSTKGSNDGANDADIDRLEKMMTSIQSPGGPDPEMQQIDGMLDRILDIQHPQRVQERIRSNSEKNKGQVFAVTNIPPENIYSVLEGRQRKKDSGKTAFFSLPADHGKNHAQSSITAVIHETQTIVSGSIVKLRLTGDIYVNGELIPHDSFIFGTAQLNGERLAIRVDGLRHGNSLFPVSLAVYDMDGMDGIYIPGAISRSVAKESADQSMQGINLGGLDPSLSAQAMNVGLEATKSFLSRKVKLVRVTVKAGYQVLLKDENQRDQK